MQEPAVLAVFLLTYLGVAVGQVPGLKIDRTGIALLGAIAMMIFSGMPTAKLIDYVNWPTLLFLFGFFVISAQLRLSGFFAAVAHSLSGRIGNPAIFLLLLMAATAGLSAILNNDVVCLAFTPIVTEALLRRKLNPVPFLIALAVASDIGAAATFVGNAQNIMIAQVAGLRFGPYMVWCLPPVLFGLGCAYAIIWVMWRRRCELPGRHEAAPAPDRTPFNRAHTVKGLVILAAVVCLFFTSWPRELIVLGAVGIHLASRKFHTNELLNLVDWPVLVLFGGLFVVTGAFQASGDGAQAVQWMGRHGVDMNSPAHVAWATAILSNLISNAAAVMLLLKVVNFSHAAMAYTLALANSFGGSLLIVGSVANIIVVQEAAKQGVAVSARDFARTGLPVTVAAIAGLVFWVRLAG